MRGVACWARSSVWHLASMRVAALLEVCVTRRAVGLQRLKLLLRIRHPPRLAIESVADLLLQKDGGDEVRRGNRGVIGGQWGVIGV